MCGIAGIYAYHYAANPIDRAELVRIRDHMTPRGSDGIGEWYSQNERVGFGHRRLSVYDTNEAVLQPLVSADQNLVVTFDGEIYNYQRLRAELELAGHLFCSESHAELILHLYLEKGEALAKHLSGMFAFGLWDARRGALLLARDPFGIKPLYYADDGWTLRFASQVKALLAGGKISRTHEPAGLVGFCLNGSVPEPFTTYQEIRAVPAGSTIWVDRIGTRETELYFSIAEEVCRGEVEQTRENDGDPWRRIHAALLDSVQRHLLPGPVGAVLSGDLQSAVLVGLIRDAGRRDIQTVTLGFEELRGGPDDQVPFVERLAAQYGARHTTRVITEEEFNEDLPKIVDAMDQPTIGGITTWFLSKAAKELGLNVVLSGLGGDSLLRGYPSFGKDPSTAVVPTVTARLPYMGAFVSRLTGSDRLSPLGWKFGRSYAHAYFERRAMFMPWELESLLGKEVARIGLRRLNPMRWIKNAMTPEPRSGVAKIAVLESSLHLRNQLLRDTDWASMAHSLQVRTPFLDRDLLREVAPDMVCGATQSRQLLADKLFSTLPNDAVSLGAGVELPLLSWMQRSKSFRNPHMPELAGTRSAWARRWAFQVAPI